MSDHVTAENDIVPTVGKENSCVDEFKGTRSKKLGKTNVVARQSLIGSKSSGHGMARYLGGGCSIAPWRHTCFLDPSRR
jgi:hypothetical protein